MKTLLKLAVGAAIAGAVVSLLVKRRAKNDAGTRLLPLTGGTGRVPTGSSGFTLEEIAGENAEWGGGGSGLNS